MPSISVVIPTYNRAEFIVPAIESVLNQRLPEGWGLEVIVVDDESTDATEDILKQFKSKIQYYKIPHSGMPAVPRNYGLKKASGELIAFQDSDDLWAPDKLLTQIELFDDEATVFSFANAETMSTSGKKSGKQVVTKKQLEVGQTLEGLLKENVVSTLTVMARKSVFDTVGGFNESPKLRAVEDYELWLRVLAAYPSGAKSINKPLAIYRQHENNISTTDAVTAVGRLINVYNALWEAPLNQKQRLETEHTLATMHENWSRLMNENGKGVPISVVMSVYNSEKFLKPAIEGILNQTFKDFEFIIIDDGSTDRSAAIIESYNDPRIRLIRQTNHKLVYSLNQGVKVARGEFIARQDADDVSLPSRLEKELTWMSANDRRGLVSSYFTYIDETTSKPSITLTFPTKHIDLVRNLYYTNPFAHSAAMIRKSAIVTAGYYRNDYDHNEDYDLWRRLAPHWELGVLPEVLLWYRISATSISHTNQDSQHSGGAKIIAELWQQPAPFKSFTEIIKDARFYKTFDSSLKPTVLQQYVGQQVQLGIDLLKHSKLKAGFHTALAALYLQPSSVTRLVRPMTFALPKRILRRVI